ncbi:unnamed protein product [Ranitomeya imitator]|uniref:protein-ribulosamine 3-kinase n=1 Tax=Ranitomeya imitator TaxID=111125 RepID=A0ABN9LGV6_9NEOB|nr:unnamed protein product [Ranitomeya imitator]
MRLFCRKRRTKKTQQVAFFLASDFRQKTTHASQNAAFLHAFCRVFACIVRCIADAAAHNASLNVTLLNRPRILQVPRFFSGVEVVPALLHGDLWGGNVAELDMGPVIFDPACFYGHWEFELAIAGMFGGFGSSFYSAYHQKLPRSPGLEKRLKLYQLFHYLNHWNHFGSGYRGSSLGIMRRLLKREQCTTACAGAKESSAQQHAQQELEESSVQQQELEQSRAQQQELEESRAQQHSQELEDSSAQQHAQKLEDSSAQQHAQELEEHSAQQHAQEVEDSSAQQHAQELEESSAQQHAQELEESSAQQHAQELEESSENSMRRRS